jgi:hypothetical protein
MPSMPWSLTVTGNSTTFGLGSSLCFFPDYMIRPFNIGIGTIVNSTAVVFSVEHSFDYTGSSVFISTAATWFPNTGITAKTTNTDGNYAYPVSAIRLNVSAASSTGTVTLKLIQAG